MCPNCYEICHIHEKILSWLNIEEEEKAREVFVPKVLQKLSHSWKNFELTQYRRRKKAREVFVTNVLQKLSHTWKFFELTQYRRRRKSKGSFCDQIVTKFVTSMGLLGLVKFNGEIDDIKQFIFSWCVVHYLGQKVSLHKLKNKWKESISLLSKKEYLTSKNVLYEA